MKALKNLSLGFYVGVLAFIVEVVALVFYFINQGTVTFGNLPLNMVTVATYYLGARTATCI